ncbi:predicted protein [Botrytis cinerea T4]|uniref:Uncharacterized protein n=1 Tax=Botryotinia fuckeliana (strain T4) TaxID=999810 RepID=G2YMK0_BOTF4|nr:predicted protein [Botrytis cinerea T4]
MECSWCVPHSAELEYTCGPTDPECILSGNQFRQSESKNDAKKRGINTRKWQ